MIDSLLIKTMRLLSPNELELLHLFVATPLFNDVRPKDTLGLFEYVKNHYPDFNAPELERDVVAMHFFPNHRNPDSELQRTMAQLLSIVRQFIAFLYVNNTKFESKRNFKKEDEIVVVSDLNNVRQQLALLRFYSQRLTPENGTENGKPGKRRERKAENIFQNLYSDVKKSLFTVDDYSYDNEYTFNDRFYFRFLLEQEKAFQSINDKRSDKLNILEALEELDTYYLVTKLDHMCRLIYFQSMIDLYEKGSEEYLRLESNKTITSGLVHALQSSGQTLHPMVRLFISLFDLMVEDNPDEAFAQFNAFVPLFEALEPKLPSSQKTTIHAILRSFWHSRYRETKNKRFLERVHQLQLEHIKTYLDKKGLPGSLFQNLIIAKLKLGDTQNARALFESYHDKLIGDQPLAWIIAICKASILVQENAPTEAATVIGHYFTYGDIDDIYLYSMAATLDVRIRYTLNDLDSDESDRMMHTASTRIRRESVLPEHRKKERLRFFTLVKALYRIKERRTMDRRADLSRDLAAWRVKFDEAPVVEWEWLEEKYNELLPQKS